MKLSLKSILYGLIFAYIVAFIWMLRGGEKVPRKEQIAVTLSLLGAIAFVLTVYDRRYNQERDLENAKHRLAFDELANQDKNFVELLREIEANYPESYEIYSEMFDIPPKQTAVRPPIADLTKKQITEDYISMKVLQSVQNFLSLAALHLPSTNEEWLTRMLQYFRSPILQKNYYKYRQNFGDDVILLVDQLIGYANVLRDELESASTIPPVDLYRNYARKITFTARL
jgi:hypothetical protein